MRKCPATKIPLLLAALRLALIIFLSGCAVGPDYQRPTTAAPTQPMA